MKTRDHNIASASLLVYPVADAWNEIFPKHTHGSVSHLWTFPKFTVRWKTKSAGNGLFTIQDVGRAGSYTDEITVRWVAVRQDPILCKLPPEHIWKGHCAKAFLRAREDAQ